MFAVFHPFPSSRTHTLSQSSCLQTLLFLPAADPFAVFLQLSPSPASISTQSLICAHSHPSFFSSIPTLSLSLFLSSRLLTLSRCKRTFSLASLSSLLHFLSKHTICPAKEGRQKSEENNLLHDEETQTRGEAEGRGRRASGNGESDRSAGPLIVHQDGSVVQTERPTLSLSILSTSLFRLYHTPFSPIGHRFAVNQERRQEMLPLSPLFHREKGICD